MCVKKAYNLIYILLMLYKSVAAKAHCLYSVLSTVKLKCVLSLNFVTLVSDFTLILEEVR